MRGAQAADTENLRHDEPNSDPRSLNLNVQASNGVENFTHHSENTVGENLREVQVTFARNAVENSAHHSENTVGENLREEPDDDADSVDEFNGDFNVEDGPRLSDCDENCGDINNEINEEPYQECSNNNVDPHQNDNNDSNEEADHQGQEDNELNNDNVLPRITHSRLRNKLDAEFSEPITERPVASRGELLLNIQEFCAQHPIPLTAQEDLHRLINSIFYQSVLPDSKYLLDALYASDSSVEYYFYCCHCYEDFGEVDRSVVKSIRCPSCETVNNISDLTKAHFFILTDFVSQFQLLLENPEIAQALRNPDQFPDNGDVLKDIYDGSMYKKFAASLDYTRNVSYVSLTGNTDGTPLFDSSTLSIWPQFVSINELPPHMRMSNVILTGLWFGKKHPKMDLYLGPFSDYIRKLSSDGFRVLVSGEEKLFKAYLLTFCVDSGARGAVQCIHSHTGESSCNWCLHPGQVEGGGSNARKFPFLEEEPEPRTMQQMIRDGSAVLNMPGADNHVNGVLGLSPLLRCPKFNIVDGFVLDVLHWGGFGIGRRMGKLWLGISKKKKEPYQANEPKPPYYVGTEETKAVINARLALIKPPLEVRRMPRDMSQVMSYNAREWENFILYYSIVLFKNILPERFLRHWCLFVQAFYLLMKTEVTKDEIGVADALLTKYVMEVEELYGVKEVGFNMHLSLHAAENSLRWGNLWCISTYAFENANKLLKQKIHGERGIPHQIIRALNRESALTVLRAKASTPQSAQFKSRMKRKELQKLFFVGEIKCVRPSTFTPTREELWLCNRKNINVEGFSQCQRIIVNHVCYTVYNGTSKTDNSYACLTDGNIVKIRRIIANETTHEVYLFVSKVRVTPYILSRRLNINKPYSPFMFNVTLIEEGFNIVHHSELKCICVNIVVNDQFLKGHFCCVLPNTVNVF